MMDAIKKVRPLGGPRQMDPARFFTKEKKTVETNCYISDKTIQPDPIHQIQKIMSKKRERHFADFYPAHPSWRMMATGVVYSLRVGASCWAQGRLGPAFGPDLLWPDAHSSHFFLLYATLLTKVPLHHTSRKRGNYTISWQLHSLFFVHGGKRKLPSVRPHFHNRNLYFPPELSFQLPPILWQLRYHS